MRLANPVEMHGVRVRAVVDEGDSQAVALVATDGRSGDLAVVGPGREKESRRDFDLAIDGDDLPFADDGTVGHGGRFAVVEGGEERRGIDPHRGDIDVADRRAPTVVFMRPVILMPTVMTWGQRTFSCITPRREQQRKGGCGADNRRAASSDP